MHFKASSDDDVKLVHISLLKNTNIVAGSGIYGIWSTWLLLKITAQLSAYHQMLTRLLNHGLYDALSRERRPKAKIQLLEYSSIST